MNNIECFEDFKQALQEAHAGITLDQRDELLIRMAITHAYLCNRDKWSKPERICKCGRPLSTPNEQFVNQCIDCEKKASRQRKYSALGYYPQEEGGQ